MVTVAEYLRQTTPKYYRQKKAVDNASDPTSLTTPQSRPQTTTAPGSAPRLNTTPTTTPGSAPRLNMTSIAANLPASGIRGPTNGSMLSTALAPTTSPKPQPQPQPQPQQQGWLGWMGSNALWLGNQVYDTANWAGDKITEGANWVGDKATHAYDVTSRTVTNFGNNLVNIAAGDLARRMAEGENPGTMDIITELAAWIPEATQQTKDDFVNDPQNQEDLYWAAKTLPGGIKQVANHLPNLYNGAIPKGENRYVYLAKQILGGDEKTNPYIGYFANRAENYTDHQFMYDLSRIMKENPQAGQMIVNRFMQEKGNPAFVKMLDGLSNWMAENGNKEGAANLKKNINWFNQHVGQLGNTAIGPEIQGLVLSSVMPEQFDKAFDKMYESNGPKSGPARAWIEHVRNTAATSGFGTKTRAYNSNVYDKEFKGDFYANNIYGILNSNAARGAMRYAAPFVNYGVPLAATGSLFGAGALWSPVLAGGLLSGAYGGLAGSGVLGQAADSEAGQTIDSYIQMLNSPLQRIASIPGMSSAITPFTGNFNRDPNQNLFSVFDNWVAKQDKPNVKTNF